MNPIQDFVIGSSWPIFIHLFYRVFYQIPLDKRNYLDRIYAIIAPFYLGSMYLIGHLISERLGFDGLSRIFLTTIVSVMGVAIFVYYQKSYPDLDWQQYIPRILIGHLFSYLIAYQIELLL